MAKIDKLVEDYFSPPQKISFDTLYEMVTSILEQDCRLPNRGDIAEGIVAAAIVAKLSKREDGAIGMVTADDIIQQVMQIQSMDSVVTNTVPDLTGDHQDTISFSIAMPKKPFAALVDPSLVQCLNGEYGGAAKYVNNASMHKFATRLANNKKSNDILVKAAGTKDQKGTKVDISIVVDGVARRNQLSLKVKGGEQFAQKTGKAFSVQEAFWSPLGIDVSSLKSAYEAIVSEIPDGKPFLSRQEIDEGGYLQKAAEATTLTYKHAYNILESRLDEDRLEIEFVKQLADYISTGAVGAEAEFIELVKIIPGGFTRARFGKKFHREMERANLYPVLSLSGSYPKIQIIYEDSEGNKSVLVQMRAKMERASGTSKLGKRYGVLMRNYLETGPALYKLAAV